MIAPCVVCEARAAVVTSITDPDRHYAAVVRCCGCGWTGPRRTGYTRLAAERRAIRAWRVETDRDALLRLFEMITTPAFKFHPTRLTTAC